MLGVAILLLGAVLVVTGVLLSVGPLRLFARGPAVRLAAAGDGLADSLGRVPAAFGVAGALSAVVVAVCWPLGWLAGKSESGVDHPVFRWVPHHQTSAMTSLMKVATLMGNRFEIKIVMAVACVGFALLLRQRAVLPVLAIVGSFVLERYTQKILSLVVHRGHPPTTLGTYPSGGCGRLIAIYGLIVFLVLHFWRPGRRVVLAAWSLLAVAGWVEGYSRIYLEKHWATDVVGGWIFGALLLGALVGTVWVLLGVRQGTAPVPTQGRRQPAAHPACGRRPTPVSRSGWRSRHRTTR